MKRFETYQKGWQEVLLTGFTKNTIYLRDLEGYNFNIPIEEFELGYIQIGKRIKKITKKNKGKNTSKPINVYKNGLLILEADSVGEASIFSGVDHSYISRLAVSKGMTRSGYSFEYAETTKKAYEVKLDGIEYGTYYSKLKIAKSLKISVNKVNEILKGNQYKGITIKMVQEVN